MDILTVVTIFLGWALGGFCNGAIGIGGTFLALPICLLVIPPNIGILSSSIVNVYSAVLLFLAFRNYTEMKEVVYIVLGSLPGCFLGTYLLMIAPVSVLQFLIGVVLLLFVFMQKFKKAAEWSLPNNKGIDALFGVASGISCTAVAMGGAPLGIYILLKHWKFLQAKGNLSCIFFVMCFVALLVQAGAGLYTVEIFELSLIGIIGCTIGQVLGVKFGKHINQQLFVRILICFLTISALILFERALA